MTIVETTPAAAAAAMEASEDVVYLDVRTEEEFVGGHPYGALNIPIFVSDPSTGQMIPNPDFQAVIEATIARTATVFCGCASGPRSAHATMLMSSWGYTDVANVHAGFTGVHDSYGRLLVPGWEALGLPVEVGEDEQRSYGALREATGC